MGEITTTILSLFSSGRRGIPNGIHSLSKICPRNHYTIQTEHEGFHHLYLPGVRCFSTKTALNLFLIDCRVYRVIIAGFHSKFTSTSKGANGGGNGVVLHDLVSQNASMYSTTWYYLQARQGHMTPYPHPLRRMSPDVLSQSMFSVFRTPLKALRK